MFSPENFFFHKKKLFHAKNHATSSPKKSRNLFTQKKSRSSDSSESNDSSDSSDQTTLYTKKLNLPKTYLHTYLPLWR